MPFIIDLPPDFKQFETTKIEYYYDQGQKVVPEINFKSAILNDDLFKEVYLKDKFENLYSTWERNTKYKSSIAAIIEDDNFQEIINMGEDAIPLIIDEIERKPSVLVWALNIITGKSLTSVGRSTVEDICKRWVKYYRG
ncbi:MAG: hypothetical protein R2781_06970 [Flavobacteriaceae bacterium]